MKEAQAEHRKLLEESTNKFETLMAQALAALTAPPTPEAVEAAANPPQAVWITGNDQERFLMLNESAVDQVNALFEQLKEVLELLAKREQGK